MMVMRFVDHFSKVIELVPLQESDVHTMAGKFLSYVVNQHGLTECIMRDHGS